MTVCQDELCSCRIAASRLLGIVQLQKLTHVGSNKATGNPAPSTMTKSETTMALLDLDHGTTRSNAASSGRIAALFGGLNGFFARRALYRQTVKELSGLSDRDLADLGISRLEIASIATAAVNGKA